MLYNTLLALLALLLTLSAYHLYWTVRVYRLTVRAHRLISARFNESNLKIDDLKPNIEMLKDK